MAPDAGFLDWLKNVGPTAGVAIIALVLWYRLAREVGLEIVRALNQVSTTEAARLEAERERSVARAQLEQQQLQVLAEVRKALEENTRLLREREESHG